MSSGNHLTIRDYFDQVLVGRVANRKAFFPQKSDTSATRTFHRILASRQLKRSINTNLQPSGLTIADYLANPVRAKCRYKLPIGSTSSEKKESKINRSTGLTAIPATKTSAAKNTSAFQPKSRGVSTLRPSVSVSSQNQTDLHEHLKIEKSIQQAARKYNLPPELIKGVIKAESNFEINAVSRAGARGLMQLMPATARELGVTNPFDIVQNIDGGSRYLRKMLDSFGGDVKQALAAYNAGPGTVRKYDGNVPYQETKQYIDRVLRFSEQTV